MCGIFGAIEFDSATNTVSLVRKGVELLHHRGPDEWGVESSGSVCFGHSRLSIIDLESGQQPMRDTRREGMICYNGEVYNFKVLRRELEGLGRKFNTNSDTEVVLNAFLEWGSGCVERLRGMFSFAAVDIEKKRILLARDRLGIKPLFYTQKNKSLFFSSELEPLYQTIGPFKMNLEALDDYLYWQYIHAPRTIYEDVRSLPPAHLVDIDLETGKVSERRYWKLQFKEDKSLSIDDWQHRLHELVREAVDLRLVSDVPFGAFLSGGTDSSIVVGYMAEILEQPVKTFSIGFNEADFSELEYAKKVADINKTEHHTEVVEAESLGLLPTLARHYGQPFADSSAIPTYYVSRMARKHVKMVLSGDGGDENFAGYSSYESVMSKMGKDGMPKGLSAKRRLLHLGFYYYWKFRSLLGMGNSVDKAYQLHCYTAHHFPPSERKKLLREEYVGVVRDILPERRALMDIGKQPMISRLQHLDLMAYLPFDILTKVDIVSMANSLEVRVPLLDHVLVETAAEMPAEFKLKEEKINGAIEYDKKHILKRVAKQRYAASLIDRPKMGFGIPLGDWFAGRLREKVRKKLLESESLPLFFDMKEVRKLLDMHSESYNCSPRIWNLLFLGEWMDSHKEALS